LSQIQDARIDQVTFWRLLCGEDGVGTRNRKMTMMILRNFTPKHQ
jgi:hypothetical protein